jgi:hypothetical protein
MDTIESFDPNRSFLLQVLSIFILVIVIPLFRANSVGMMSLIVQNQDVLLSTNLAP